MSRYIDVDKLLDALCGMSDTENGDVHFMNGVNTVIEAAESMVEKDVGKIVHCGDCVYKGQYKCRYNNMWVDNHRDYCSNARKIAAGAKMDGGKE